VVPRLAATVTSLLALAVVSNLTAVFFGMVIGTLVLGIPYDLYVSNTISQLKMSDFLTGLMKAGVFGLLLGLIACYNGLRVTGGAAGVGKATTETVVQTVIFVILSDLFFSAIFYAIGWT
jgi:phospholipid/cholesterol/gamma-HCH transport system permease protein